MEAVNEKDCPDKKLSVIGNPSLKVFVPAPRRLQSVMLALTDVIAGFGGDL